MGHEGSEWARATKQFVEFPCSFCNAALAIKLFSVSCRCKQPGRRPLPSQGPARRVAVNGPAQKEPEERQCGDGHDDSKPCGGMGTHTCQHRKERPCEGADASDQGPDV